MEFFPVKITSKKVHQNDVNFLPMKIISSKACRNDVKFSPIEIALKKFVETTWKFVDISFSTSRCNIDIKFDVNSTCCVSWEHSSSNSY